MFENVHNGAYVLLAVLLVVVAVMYLPFLAGVKDAASVASTDVWHWFKGADAVQFIILAWLWKVWLGDGTDAHLTEQLWNASLTNFYRAAVAVVPLAIVLGLDWSEIAALWGLMYALIAVSLTIVSFLSTYKTNLAQTIRLQDLAYLRGKREIEGPHCCGGHDDTDAAAASIVAALEQMSKYQ